MSHRHFRLALLSAACTVTMTSSAFAAGFYIQEQSVRGLGSAFSGSVTTLDDASTIFFNPGGMTQLEGAQLQGGVHVLIPNAKLKDRGTTSGTAAALPLGDTKSKNPYDPTPIPNGFFSYQLTDNLWAGIGVTAPFGLGSDYGTTWFGRFDSTKTELAIIDVQPTVAWKVNDWLSVGGGVNIQRSDADLRKQQVLAPTQEGAFKLEGDDFGYGYSLGAQIRPFQGTTIGVNYKSEVHHDLDGNLKVFSPTGAIVAAQSSDGNAKLVTPDHATFGIAQKLTDRWTIMGQATWFGWNNFQDITIRRKGSAAPNPDPIMQNYQTTWAFAAGAEYEASPNWTFRGGVQFDESPTTNEFRTSRTPDGDRTWASLGATYAINEKLDLDLAATYIHVKGESIDIVRDAGRTRADIEGDVGIVAVGLSYKF